MTPLATLEVIRSDATNRVSTGLKGALHRCQGVLRQCILPIWEVSIMSAPTGFTDRIRVLYQILGVEDE